MNCYQVTDNPKSRFRYGMVASIFGILSNLILFALKLAVGIISFSITIIADAVNNISDAGSSIVTLIGFKLSSKPADKNHPFGHARYEYITALIIAVIIFGVGISLLENSIEKAIHPEAIIVSTFTYIVIGISIVFKLVQMIIYYIFSKKINSQALRNESIDSGLDTLATSVVLISIIVMDLTQINIDGYMGILVSLFITISSLLMLKDTINPILGAKPDEKLVSMIRSKILSYDGIIDMHDLTIHNYGPDTCFVIAHVEMAASTSLIDAHELIDNIEHEFHTKLNINLNLHIDPVNTKDKEEMSLKDEIQQFISSYSPNMSMHDFRIYREEDLTKVYFDLLIPYELNIDVNNIKNDLDNHYQNHLPKYQFIIDIDHLEVL